MLKGLYRKMHFAGKYISNPEELPVGCHVAVQDRKCRWHWEYGTVCIVEDGKKAVNCWDGVYEFSEAYVFLDTRYRRRLKQV